MTTRTSDVILFKKEYSPRKGPLFQTKTNLCKEIYRHPDSPYKNYQLGSLKSLVSLMLMPASSANSRPISNEFKEVLFKCIEEEFPKDRQVYLQIVEELEASFKELKEEENNNRGRNHIHKLLATIEEAESLAFCNFIPSRLPKAYALDLQTALEKRFKNEDIGPVQFFFSTESQKRTLIHHWQDIKHHLASDVMIAVCEKAKLAPPLCIAEPTRNSRGFYLHDYKDSFDPYPLDDKYIEEWEIEIYLPFENTCRPIFEKTPEPDRAEKIRRIT